MAVDLSACGKQSMNTSEDAPIQSFVSESENIANNREFFIADIGSASKDAQTISTVEDLLRINDNPSAHYVLANNIDVSAICKSEAGWAPLCDKRNNGVDFTGTLDGRGFVISGLTIEAKEEYASGLFFAIGEGGVVKNLGFDNVVVISQASGYFGGIAQTNSGTIENCFINGQIAVRDSSFPTVSVGGICSSNFGNIKDCYFWGAIGVSLSGGNKLAQVGGITDTNRGSVSHCFVAGQIDILGGFVQAGGISGLNAGTIADCAVFADIKTRSNEKNDVGGICGRLQADEVAGAAITRCLVTGSISIRCDGATVFPAAGGIGGYAVGFGTITDCVVLCSGIEATSVQGSYWIALIACIDDGYWEEGMPFVTKSNNYALEDCASGIYFHDADFITLKDASSLDFYQTLGWDFNNLWRIAMSTKSPVGSYPIFLTVESSKEAVSKLDKIQTGETHYSADIAFEALDATANDVSIQSEAAPKEPFWGVWVYASKNESEAQQFAEDVRSSGVKVGVVLTTDWSNLNTESWYVVYIGPFSNQTDAETAQTQAVNNGYSNAYTKYSGDYQGS
jgi:hypothetical protein